MAETNLSRRRLLKAGAVTSAALLAGGPRALARALKSTGSTSSEGVLGLLVVDSTFVVDRDLDVAGVVVQRGGTLVFSPDHDITLVSRGNVVVEGLLCMRPQAGRVHTLRFEGVDEQAFQGAGMEIVDSDTGLWVAGTGRLDAAGSRREPWARAISDIPAGSTVVELDRDPLGWRPGDEIVVVPSGPPGRNHELTYDKARIVALEGRRVFLSARVRHDHPMAELKRGMALGAEILNLTRDVRIEGTPEGRAHLMFLHCTQPQSVSGVALRHVGPRRKEGAISRGVMGRYGVHFHHCGDGSRGSVVEDVVVTQAGNHAFVAHASHGVTFRGCIAHDTVDAAYWWDGRGDQRVRGLPSDDVAYEGCVASLVSSDPPYRGFRLSGFTLGEGRGNRAVGCVAVGIQGNDDAAGFSWPEGSGGVWTFEDCVSHNNSRHGVFVWQNTSNPHRVIRLAAYHNGYAGISHGAYLNSYRYEDVTLYRNGFTGLFLWANSHGRGMVYDKLYCDQAGESDHAVVVWRHTLSSRTPVRFDRCHFRGAREACVGFVYEGSNGRSTAERFRFTDCRFEGNEFWLASRIHPGSLIEVRDRALGRLELRRRDASVGRLNRRWNARVRAL